MKVVWLLNNTSVGVFGIILSAAYCDILWTQPKRRIFAVSLVVLLLFQGICCFFVNPAMIQKIYPVITHFPLTILLCILSRRRFWPVVSVLTAYLCCQIRRWLALLFSFVLSGDLLAQNITELVLTLPLLLFLIRLIAPSMRSISHSTGAVQFQFGLMPMLYYGFDYLTRIYTDLLLEDALVVLEFMPFVCCMSYLVYVLYSSEAERARSQLEQTKTSLNIQIAQAVREIEILRESQKKASAYRHDLRHHMQFLSSCIAGDRLEQAQAYIREICSETEAGKVTVFCENEAANLILSSFAGRAEEHGISIRIRAAFPRIISVSESDLCVLLSNALENALHACQRQKKEGRTAEIDVLAYEKNRKLFLQIVNSCDQDITFSRGIPVTDRPGHGIGVRSICAVVERYGGMYTFSVADHRFILRISM